jgi:hypothetical protein
LGIHYERSAPGNDSGVLDGLDPGLRARLLAIVAGPCRAGGDAYEFEDQSLGVVDEETEQLFDRTWRAANAAGFEAGRAGERLACADDLDHFLVFVVSRCEPSLRGPVELLHEAARYGRDAFGLGWRAGIRECLGRTA